MMTPRPYRRSTARYAAPKREPYVTPVRVFFSLRVLAWKMAELRLSSIWVPHGARVLAPRLLEFPT